MTPKLAGQILVVDDDHFSRQLYCDLLAQDGHRVLVAESAREAFDALKNNPVDLVITDLVMPDADGFEVLHFINQNFPLAGVIVVTGYADVESAVRALKSGAKDYLRKPVNIEEFRLIIQRCLEQQSLFSENREFRRYLDLFEMCHRIAGCLDREKLLPLSLHALGQALEAHDGFAFYPEEERGDLQFVPLTLGSDMEAKALADFYARALGKKDLWDVRETVVIDKPAFPDHIERTVVLPIVIEHQLRALFLLLYHTDSVPSAMSSEMLQERAKFMGRQIALSMDNAEKFVQARAQAYVDDLTGLYNARYLGIALNREFKRAMRFTHPVSVLFMDLDRFKSINDKYGHLVGSKMLVETSEVLRECLREIDTAVRYGGDEFTVILVETDSGGATKVAERIRSAIEEHAFLKDEGLNLHVTACIGIACYPEHAKSVQELIDMADQAMYRGKNTTRNVVYIFNPGT